MKFDIKNRWTQAVMFTADIECEADAGEGFKLGLAAQAAIKAGADLYAAIPTATNGKWRLHRCTVVGERAIDPVALGLVKTSV